MCDRCETIVPKVQKVDIDFIFDPDYKNEYTSRDVCQACLKDLHDWWQFKNKHAR